MIRLNNFGVLSLVGLLCAGLVACGGNDGPAAPAADTSDGTSVTEAAAPAQPVVVYSSRAEQLIQPIFTAFTEETGIAVEYITDSAQPLIERIKAEADTTPASVLLTVDAGVLWYAAEQGILQPMASDIVSAAVPQQYRDPDGLWTGLSLRARTIVYDTRKVSADELVGYADLADSRWAGKLCLRTSKKVYNQSLVATMIASMGEEKTEEIVRGWVANLAQPEFSNDTKLIEAIEDGRCQVGIVNSYYFGRLQRDNELSAALFWQPAELGGVHVNVSGAGITANAPNVAGATALLEWLAGPAGQELFAGLNLEFPVLGDVPNDPIVAAWGEFAASEQPLIDAGRLQADAVKLMARAGYN
ncbi:MAG: extracellular solute-binding protein [Pseudomonadota bacterium]